MLEHNPETQAESGNRLTIAGLVAANLLPIILALIFRWNIGDVVMFYWWENIIIGFYTILRILFAHGSGLGDPRSRFGLAPFFTFHYFFFCFIHVTFLRVLFFEGGLFRSGIQNSGLLPDSAGFIGGIVQMVPQAGWIGLAALVGSHGMFFAQDYILNGRYKTAIPVAEMFRPYGRIVVLQLCIIAGGFAVLLLGSPIIMVVLLMIGKTALEVGSHTTTRTNRLSKMLKTISEAQEKNK